jgi:hypothetical protein
MIVNQRVISTICNVSIPAGTAISVLSPTFFPSKPLAIGEFTDIFIYGKRCWFIRGRYLSFP